MIYTPTLIILLSIVFIVVWAFTNTIDKRKWLSFLISLLLTPIVYFYLLYPLINIFSSYHHLKHFEAKAWKNAPALRYEMSHEIISQQLFYGKTKEDVKATLGTPEWYGWDNTINANSKNKWNYNLGFKPGAFNMNQECLELIFTNNTVTNVRQYQLKKDFE